MLIAIGAIVLLISTSITWISAANSVAGGTVTLDGATAVPAARAVAVLALAAVGGILATRGAVRTVISLVAALAGALVVVFVAMRWVDGFASVAAAALPASLDGSPATVISRSLLGPVLATVSGCAIAVGGVLAAVTAGRSPGMSERFERNSAPVPGQPTTRADLSATSLWAAQDRGEDPTDS